jgi:hypothetical protein
MSNKLIIFSHHYKDNFVYQNFDLLKRLNPSWDVISIGFTEHKEDLIENSIVVDSSIYPTNEKVVEARPRSNPNWTQADLFLYDIYHLFPKYDKYFLIEYDTIFNCAIEDFFSKINDCDHFGSNVFNRLTENWIFTKIYFKYNPNHLPLDKLGSIGQTTCVYLNNNLLKQVTSEIISNPNLYTNMDSELRLGTLIKKFVPHLINSRNDIHKFISWDTNNITLDKTIDNFFYHPYKNFK